MTTAIALASTAIGLVAHRVSIQLWPDLERSIGLPWSELVIAALYTILPPMIIAAVVFLVLLLLAPSQKWAEQTAQVSRRNQRIRELRRELKSDLEVTHEVSENSGVTTAILIVYNSSPRASAVFATVENVEVVEANDRERAETIASRVQGMRLLPRQLELSGRGRGRFHFVSASMPGGVSIAIESSVVQPVMDGLMTEIITSQLDSLPQGKYRIRVSVSGQSHVSTILEFEVSASQDGVGVVRI